MAEPRIEMLVPLQSKTDGSWFVDPQLRTRIVADAATREFSLSDTINAVLGEKYGVPFEGRKQTTTPEPDKDHLRFQMPVRLHTRIRSRTPHPLAVNDSVRAALSEHYGLPLPARNRSRRRSA